jgi:hypothetical protein
METALNDEIQAGWDVVARDGTPAGTVAEVGPDTLTIRPAVDAEAVTVARHLVMEAHAGRVELDIDPAELGIAAPRDQAAPPKLDPGAPPMTATPEQTRRITGG